MVFLLPFPFSAGIGIGFYGNSETSDGVSQLSSALLHANHTLSTIDDVVREPATDQTADSCPSWSSYENVVPHWRTKAAKSKQISDQNLIPRCRTVTPTLQTGAGSRFRLSLKTHIQPQACTSVYIPSTKETSSCPQAKSKATDPVLGPNAISGTPPPPQTPL